MTAARLTTGERLARRVIDFARGLRTAGLPVDSGRIAVALHAVAAVGVHRRDDLHAALQCTLVGAREHQAPFDAIVQVIEGEAELKIGGKRVLAREGEMVIMPANIPHAVRAKKQFKMLLTMLRAK